MSPNVRFDLRVSHVGATRAAEQVAAHAPGWWLHTELNVLAGDEFSACGAARSRHAWRAFLGGALRRHVIGAANGRLPRLESRRLDPDLDPARRSAQQIVNFLAKVIGGRVALIAKCTCVRSKARGHAS